MPDQTTSKQELEKEFKDLKGAYRLFSQTMQKIEKMIKDFDKSLDSK